MSRAWYGIPVLLMCSCATPPVKHYTMIPKGASQAAQEATFRATEAPGIKPFVKIDGREFSVGTEVEEAARDGFIYPFRETEMRSLEVQLPPGPHKVDVAIKWIYSWSLPFSKGRTISFDAEAGKSYELQIELVRFNDLRATGNIDWETKVVEVGTKKEFRAGPDSPRQL